MSGFTSPPAAEDRNAPMMLPRGATIAIIDGHALRLFHNHGSEAALDLREEERPKVEPAHGSGGMRHHSSSANPDRSRLAEDDYAAGAAEWLNREALGGKITGLVVIAAPKTLGELRRLYHKAVETRLLGEIAREMTEATPAAIAALVQEH